MSWFRGSAKTDPETKVWEQIAFLGGSSRRNGERVGKSDRDRRKSLPCGIDEVPAAGSWDPQRDLLEPSLSLTGMGYSVYFWPLLNAPMATECPRAMRHR